MPCVSISRNNVGTVKQCMSSIRPLPLFSHCLVSWQIDQLSELTQVHKKNIKSSLFCNKLVRFFSFFPSSSSSSLISRCRMRKYLAETAPFQIRFQQSQLGQSQSSSTEPSPRSQSPAPSTPVLQSHSRRHGPRTLDQGITFKYSIPCKFGNTCAALKDCDQNGAPRAHGGQRKTYGELDLGARNIGIIIGETICSSINLKSNISFSTSPQSSLSRAR
jgi:hypothetical protein